MKTRSFGIFALIFLLITLHSCDVLKQASEMTRLSKCEFRLDKISNINLAGINVQNMKNYEDLNFLEIAKLTTAVASNNLPLSFVVDVEGKNPNSGNAAMNRFEWIMFVDDVEMTRGVINDRVELPANGGIATLPLSISVNLMELLSGESGDALMNFGFNLAGAGNEPTRILVKAKPTIYIGGTPIEYPGYINIRTDFTSGGSGSGSPTQIKM